MDIEHSAINQIQRTGFPNHEYIEYEQRLMTEEIVEDSDEWPDGMSWGNWQKEKRARWSVSA